MQSRHSPRFLMAASAVLIVAVATGCSAQPQPAGGAAGDAAVGCPVAVTDGWVKATDEEMTAAFGTLANASSTAVTVTSAAVPGAATVELHEVVDDDGTMTMRRVEAGFAVPAGGAVVLEPGGRHLMLMGLTRPLVSGRELTVTLTCENGATATFAAQVKDYAGAEERYESHGSGM